MKPTRRDRRKFLEDLGKLPCGMLLLGVVGPLMASEAEGQRGRGSPGTTTRWASRSIAASAAACASKACKVENDVPQEPYFFRTWVERYSIHEDGEVAVDSPEGGINGFPRGRRGAR